MQIHVHLTLVSGEHTDDRARQDHHQLGCPGMAHGQWHAHTVCALYTACRALPHAKPILKPQRTLCRGNWHGPDAVMDTEVVHTIMGHHAGHGGYDCDAGYSNWEHGWPQP